MDSYEIAQQILKLYQQHANKSSGEISKNNLEIPLFFETPDDFIHQITTVLYDEKFGIILK